MIKKLKPVGSEVEQIRAQQKELSNMRRDTLEPLGEAVTRTNKSGRSLVQSAGPGVSTMQLERDLEKMNDSWNDIKEKVNIGRFNKYHFYLNVIKYNLILFRPMNVSAD